MIEKKKKKGSPLIVSFFAVVELTLLLGLHMFLSVQRWILYGVIFLEGTARKTVSLNEESCLNVLSTSHSSQSLLLCNSLQV